MDTPATVQASGRQRLRITLVRSPIGFDVRQKRIVKSLGLRRMHQTVEHDDAPWIRGMLVKVGHMLKVEPLPEGVAATYRATTGTERFRARMAKKQLERAALLAELGFFDEIDESDADDESADEEK